MLKFMVGYFLNCNEFFSANHVVVGTIEINKKPQHLLMQLFQLHLVIDNHSLPRSIYCIFGACVSYIVNTDVTVLKMAWSVLLKACAYFL